MFVRRRPLLRAAVVGGGAYLAGKRSAQRSAGQRPMGQQPMSQGPMVPPQGADPSQGAPAAEPDTPTVSDQLAQLSSLHMQGSLSDAEFAAAKARLLGK